MCLASADAIHKITPAMQKSVLVTYLRVKLAAEDWHAVADVACDIRELEAAHPELKEREPG